MRLALVGACALSCGLQCAVSVVSPGIIIIVHLDASNAVLYRHLFVSLARFPHIRALNTFAKYRLATWRKNFGKCRIGTIYKEYLLGAGIKACTSLPQSDTTVQGIAPCISSRANTAMFIAVAAYQIAYRGMGAAAANDCSQNKTQQIVFVLHYIYYICRVIYKLWQTYKKKYRTRVFISRKLTHMLLCVLIFTRGLMPIMFWWWYKRQCNSTIFTLSEPISCLCPPAVVHIARHLSAPICREHFLFSHYQLSLVTPRLFVLNNPEKHLCQSDFSVRATENPPSRNRKPRFASPQKQSTAPSLGVSPYVSWGHADASPWPSAA